MDSDSGFKLLQRNHHSRPEDPDGFFLMVEGGQIDWAAHDMDAERVINNVIGFDNAVLVGLNYQVTDPNALIIVTADHETGRMTVSSTSSEFQNEDGPFYTPGGDPFYVNWAFLGGIHTGESVPTSAQGNLADRLTETYENSYIYQA